MTKQQLIITGVFGWIVWHAGLVMFGAIFGVALSLPFIGHAC